MKSSLLAFMPYVLLIVLIGVSCRGISQDILIFSENFLGGGSTFTLNSGGPSSGSGINQWVVNNQYGGTVSCPETPDQSTANTNGGTISGAPQSNYLHIQNTTAGGGNACFDQGAASDQFAIISSGFCTFGLEEVHISFFWIGEGNANAYGSLWYQADGGGWIQAGPNLNNSSIWQYEDITLPEFSNVGSLQFGFRFMNDGSGTNGELSLGIDEINVVASLSTLNPVNITITSVSPNPVCEGTFLTVSYEISEPLCDGTYLLELSDASGNYPSGFTSWAVNIAYPATTGSTTILLPGGAAAASCYTVRLSRISPEPAVTGTASACFEIIECPNTITTAPLGPPVVTLDPLPVCVGSVIDVPFFSIGVFDPNNTYICQLSEPDGTFSTSPLIVGSSSDSDTYDPALLPPPPTPGNVSGIIPDTEPGCNYYLRIVSSSPNVIGTVWGPFCIQRCDVTTNDLQDISFCITECSADPGGASDVIFLNTNTNNQTVTYASGNSFTTQLLSSMDFSQIGPDGILGEVIATQDDFLTITIPCLEDALASGIPAGMNYLRVIATDPSDPANAVSTLIRVTIGLESSVPITLNSYDFAVSGYPEEDTLCAPASILLNFAPYDPSDNSTYMWSCSGINGGAPFESPDGPTSNVLLVTAQSPVVLDFLVQRTNYGCVSPWSPTHTVVVTGAPLVAITGPPQVCLGDTISYQVPFSGSTYYSWSNDAATSDIAYQDTSNNVLNIAFSNTGAYTLDLNVLNQCGVGSDSQTITVVDPPSANAGSDMAICEGEEAILHLQSGPSLSYSWSSTAGPISNANDPVVIPVSDTEYYGTVTSNLGCTDTDTLLVTLTSPDTPVHYTDSICPGGDNTIILESDSTGTYFWSTGSTDYYTEVNDTGTYFLNVETLFSICPHYVTYQVSAAQPTAPIMLTDSVCPGGNEYIRLQADAQGRYEWNTGQVNSFISVNQPGIYILNIFGNDAPCARTLHFTITPDTCIIVPPDTIPYEEVWAWVPNSFTANQDGINEVFGPVFSNANLVRDYRFNVYDRWGNLVFSSVDPFEKWTGSFQGGAHYINDGVYNWQLIFRGAFEVNAQSRTGTLLIWR
jgi:hypothetical protein